MNTSSFSIDKIDVGFLEHAFEEDSFETTYYLDLENSELHALSEYSDLPDEDLRRKIENDPGDRFLRVPRGDSDEAWRDMQKFALNREDESLRERLLNAIQGSGAFRRFKDLVFEEGIRQEWYEFRDRRIRRRVLDWLLSKDLITQEQREEYMEKLEQRIQYRKQRQQDLEEMGQGDTVECRDPAGYSGLSEGTRYDVVGERPDDNLIRIRDDSENRSWYPKNQFDLVKAD
ncbi:MAG: UPF0158 family protein [bacterium]